MKKVLILLALLIECFSFRLSADTVVCIHGFFATWRTMTPLKHAFEKRGLDVCLWGYPSGRKYIQEHAWHLLPILQQIACECPGVPIHFATHSIGALVLRCAINMPGCPDEAKIGRAVLLAPPNQGSCLARRFQKFLPVTIAMGTKSGRQLLYYTPEEIASCCGEFPSTMQVLVVAGTDGNRVLFKETNDCFLKPAETYLNTPFYFQAYPITHGKLITSECVLDQISDFILCGSPSPPYCGLGVH